MIVCNKIDLIDKSAISEMDVKNLAEELNCKYVMGSAFQDIGVDVPSY